MVVYVDDFKLAGPKGNLREGWKLIRSGLQMETPTPIGVFLGCNHVRETITLTDGTKATMMKYEMEGFMRSCVDRYLEHAPGMRLKTVETPFLPEDQMTSPQGAPKCAGAVGLCPWCSHSFSPSEMRTFKDEKELEAYFRSRRKAQQEDNEKMKTNDLADRGKLASSAASIVMKILYGARFVRMDLLRIIGFLACSFTRWTSSCDKRLYRLVCYLNSTVTAGQYSWVADSLDALQPTP